MRSSLNRRLAGWLAGWLAGMMGLAGVRNHPTAPNENE